MTPGCNFEIKDFISKYNITKTLKNIKTSSDLIKEKGFVANIKFSKNGPKNWNDWSPTYSQAKIYKFLRHFNELKSKKGIIAVFNFTLPKHKFSIDINKYHYEGFMAADLRLLSYHGLIIEIL